MGLPMLSMHSVREMCGVEDIDKGIDALQSVLEGSKTIQAMWTD
jgi:aspartyl aminopeptidase